MPAEVMPADVLSPSIGEYEEVRPSNEIGGKQKLLRDLLLKKATPRLETKIIAGAERIVALRDLLLAVAERYEQTGVVDHLEYFLSFKESQLKIPHVVLIGENMESSGVSSRTVVGALLTYEHRVLGVRTGIFATDDVAGRRTLIAPDYARERFAKLASEALMKQGARAAVQCFSEKEEMIEAPTVPLPRPQKIEWAYASARRLTRSHLALEATVALTLAGNGQNTRRNVRRYRQRAEAELGATFVEHVEMTREEYVEFNRLSAHAVSDESAGWRYDSLKLYEGMFLCGLRDRDGRWLSLMGGRHYGTSADVDWQLNRSDLPGYSLSIVMRAYHLEYEIRRGTTKVYIEGGTRQAIHISMATHLVHDLVVVRNSWMIRLMRQTVPVMIKVVNRYLPKSSHPLHLLTDRKILWRPWV